MYSLFTVANGARRDRAKYEVLREVKEEVRHGERATLC